MTNIFPRVISLLEIAVLFLIIGYLRNYLLKRLNSSFEKIPISDLSNSLATLNNENLDKFIYRNTRLNFQIVAPKDWKVDTSGSHANIEFNCPVPHEVAILTLAVEPSRGTDAEKYSEGVLEGFTRAGGKYLNLKIISQEGTEIDNQPALKIEFTYMYDKGTPYPFHGMYIICVNNKKGYTVFASAQEEYWSKYLPMFNSSLSMFAFTDKKIWRS